MGEVWRARDTKLDREVAIKVLPEAMPCDKARVLRFERDAKLLASLSYSKIARIFGFEAAAVGWAPPAESTDAGNASRHLLTLLHLD